MVIATEAPAINALREESVDAIPIGIYSLSRLSLASRVLQLEKLLAEEINPMLQWPSKKLPY